MNVSEQGGETTTGPRNRPMEARITFAGFEPASWLQLLIEHHIAELLRDDADLRGCRVLVRKTQVGWDVTLHVDAASGGIGVLASTLGTRPKDALAPVREAFSRTRRQLRRSVARARVLPLWSMRVEVTPDRTSRSGSGVESA